MRSTELVRGGLDGRIVFGYRASLSLFRLGVPRIPTNTLVTAHLETGCAQRHCGEGGVRTKKQAARSSLLFSEFLPSHQKNCWNSYQKNYWKLVEAAGVEPASEIAVSREDPCSVQFRMFSPQTLRTDKMRLKLVR